MAKAPGERPMGRVRGLPGALCGLGPAAAAAAGHAARVARHGADQRLLAPEPRVGTKLRGFDTTSSTHGCLVRTWRRERERERAPFSVVHTGLRVPALGRLGPGPEQPRAAGRGRGARQGRGHDELRDGPRRPRALGSAGGVECSHLPSRSRGAGQNALFALARTRADVAGCRAARMQTCCASRRASGSPRRRRKARPPRASSRSGADEGSRSKRPLERAR